MRESVREILIVGEKMSITKTFPRKPVRWLLLGGAAFLAIRVYYLQEMVAALVLFAVLFSCIAAVVLLLIVLDYNGEAILASLQLHAKNLLHQAGARRTFSQPRYRI